ncbi:MAG TPA: hypothetical protein VEI57_08280 [Nitrospirota bacterium]|nr:hypothetical protein [Nitrospirota bacterium]
MAMGFLSWMDMVCEPASGMTMLKVRMVARWHFTPDHDNGEQQYRCEVAPILELRGRVLRPAHPGSRTAGVTLEMKL